MAHCEIAGLENLMERSEENLRLAKTLLPKGGCASCSGELGELRVIRA